MSEITRHKGVVEETGSRCIVVFREMPEDTEHALVVFADTVPEVYSTSLARIVDGVGQTTKDLYEVLHGEIAPDGRDFLSALHLTGKLRKVRCNKILMHITPSFNMRLSELNAQIRGETLHERPSESNDLQQKLNPYKQQNEVHDSEQKNGIAERLLMEAQDFEDEAQRKRNRAYELRPELKVDIIDTPIQEIQEQKEVNPNLFTLDLTGLTQKEATKQIQDAWREINKKPDVPTSNNTPSMEELIDIIDEPVTIAKEDIKIDEKK